MDELLTLLKSAWPYVLAASTGAFALWRQVRSDSQASRKDQGDLIRIAQEAAGAVIGDLREELGRLRQHVEELEAELTQLQKRHSDMMADKDAKITLLEGEKRQLQAQIDAYRDLLVRNNIPLPKQSQAYWIADGGELKPMAAQAASNPGT